MDAIESLIDASLQIAREHARRSRRGVEDAGSLAELGGLIPGAQDRVSGRVKD